MNFFWWKCRSIQHAMKHKRLLLSSSRLLSGGAYVSPSNNSKEMDPTKKYDDLADKESMDFEMYYDNLAKDYDVVVVGNWKYDMPKQVTKVISKTISDGDVYSKGQTLRILDCGCGTGLFGVELNSALRSTLDFSLAGVDISENMLERSNARNVYAALTKTDINKNGIPFVDNFFDIVVCVGTTSNLEPEITTREWLRVAKPGAMISFTHKTSVWDRWEKLQEELVREGKWEILSVSDELPYLPEFDQYQNERAKIYVYRKI